jgi:sporulation protein YlmC with PRC-barrel domain
MQAIDKSIKLDCIHSTYNIPYAELDTLTNKEILHIWSNIKDGTIPPITFDLKHNRTNTLILTDQKTVIYETSQPTSSYFESKIDALMYAAGFRVGIPVSSTKTPGKIYHRYNVTSIESTSLLIWLLQDR